MTVSQLIDILSDLDGDIDVVINSDEICWPVCFEDSSLIEAPTPEGGIKFYFLLTPCHGHEGEEILQDFRSTDLDINEN